MRLAIQLYTLRDVDDSLLETLDRIGDTQYEGVQFSGLHGETPEDLVAALDENGLDVADAHVSLEDLESDYEEVVETHRSLGCDRLVVSAYDQEAFETEDGARAAGEHLAELAERVEDDGLELHYHNHTFEFTPLESNAESDSSPNAHQTTFDVFASVAEGVGLEIDTGLATHGGADPIALLERYADRVDLVHLTDCRPDEWEGRHSDLGTGTVDIEACVHTAREIGTQWIIFEHGLTDDPLASARGAKDAVAPLFE